MDYLDPLIGPGDALFPFTDDIDRLAAQVIEAIRHRQAGAVITHGVNGEYGHPAHVLAHQAVRLALHALADEAPLFYTSQATYAAHPYPKLANIDASAHLLVDTRPVLGEKVAAAMCHRSQHALFVRWQSQEQGRPLTVPEVLFHEESLHRVSPVFDGAERVQDALADLLWNSGYARLPVEG